MGELLAEHGTVERQPLLEGRNMYIVMAPLDRRAEKPRAKPEEGEAATAAPAPAATARRAASGVNGQPSQPPGETIGDAMRAKMAARAPATPAEAPQGQES
jgi:hypothetical protein